MSNLSILKNHLTTDPSKKESLIDFIENELHDEDIDIVLNHLEEQDWKAHLSSLSYSESGDLEIKSEYGVTFIKN